MDLWGEAGLRTCSLCCWFWMKLFTLCAGYSESSSAGCKQYTVGFTALDDSSSTATAEIAVNGMDPPELGFSPAESTTGTSGQPRHVTCSRPHTPAVAATADYGVSQCILLWCEVYMKSKQSCAQSVNFIVYCNAIKWSYLLSAGEFRVLTFSDLQQD